MKCSHRWTTKDKNVAAEYRKRDQGPTFFCDGDYEECDVCWEGRFVPHNFDLAIVSCVKKTTYNAEEK